MISLHIICPHFYCLPRQRIYEDIPKSSQALDKLLVSWLSTLSSNHQQVEFITSTHDRSIICQLFQKKFGWTERPSLPGLTQATYSLVLPNLKLKAPRRCIFWYQHKLSGCLIFIESRLSQKTVYNFIYIYSTVLEFGLILGTIILGIEWMAFN